MYIYIYIHTIKKILVCRLMGLAVWAAVFTVSVSWRECGPVSCSGCTPGFFASFCQHKLVRVKGTGHTSSVKPLVFAVLVVVNVVVQLL